MSEDTSHTRTLVLEVEVRDTVMERTVAGDSVAGNGPSNDSESVSELQSYERDYFICNNCGQEMNHKSPLESHIQCMDTEDKMFFCGTCGKTNSTSVSLQAHLKANDEEIKFMCSECDQPFVDASEFTKHKPQYQKKPKDMTFSCGICCKIFTSKGKCSAHQKTHSDPLNGTEMPKDALGFPCDVCGHIFKTNKKVREHQRMHTGEKPFCCDVCGKSFSRQDRLKIHKRYHTGERPYKCPHCDKNFTENSTLYRHIATHDETEERPFCCDQCPKSFRRKFQLLAHISSHVGEKKNKCSHCGKCFAAPSLLREHLRVHSGEKPFPCSVCKKNFRNLAHVKRHMLTHTKPKPFQCVECDKLFGLEVRLENHVRRTGHTGKNQFACPHCKRTFRKKSNFNNHVKSHKNSEGDISSSSQEKECAIEEVQNSTKDITLLCGPQPAGPVDGDSTVNIQNDQIIQVLICTNDGKVVENRSEFENRIPANASVADDEEQSGCTSMGNHKQDLSTVVILLQNDLQDGSFDVPSENIQTEAVEKISQLRQRQDF